ncbi:carboxylating nicotinate-nucleotide diphosphorylase [Patescibacteria group bacterium]
MIKDRAQLTEKLFNQKDLLTVKTLLYKQWVFRYTFLELEKDLNEHGDITSDSLIHDSQEVIARIYANQDGVMAGGEEINYFVLESDPTFKPRLNEVHIVQRLEDGKKFKKDDMLMELKGDIKDILKAERSILNLLQHMCGIATTSKRIIDKAKKSKPHVCIAPTRKTTWGLIDKKAVTIAGGATHRLNLADSILIKDNHLAYYKYDLKKLFASFKPPKHPYKFFEIEIEDTKTAIEAAKLISQYQSKKILPNEVVMMLDNMSPKEIEKTLAALQQESLYDVCLFEASGGINEENIVDYANTGVDVISLGLLTQNIQPIDLSLEIGNV